MHRFLLCAVVVVGAAGCASELESDDSWETDDALIAAGDLDAEEGGSDGDGSSTGLSATSLAVRTNANFRVAPGVGNDVIRVLPTGTVVKRESAAAGETAVSGWSKISYRGIGGYMASSLLVAAPTPQSLAQNEALRQEILDRARGALGYSYWRGRSKWVPFAATANEPPGYIAGRSTGGTDCSGLVGKVWQVPSWNTDTQDHKRAYVTRHFRYSTSKEWVRVSRPDAKPADAYVWNDGAVTGHIVVVRSTDAWGSVLTIEAKGKQYGIVEDTRKLGSQYVAIRKRNL